MNEVSRPLTPYEQGEADAAEAIARGDLPCKEALDRAAAIIAASPPAKPGDEPAEESAA